MGVNFTKALWVKSGNVIVGYKMGFEFTNAGFLSLAGGSIFPQSTDCEVRFSTRLLPFELLIYLDRKCPSTIIYF